MMSEANIEEFRIDLSKTRVKTEKEGVEKKIKNLNVKDP